MGDIAIKERWHLSKEYQNENIKVYFIGDVISGKSFKLEPHRNPGYEICMIPYGRGFFSINDKKYVMKTNQIFMTRADQIHYGMPVREDPYRIYYICFEIKKTAEKIFVEAEKYFKRNKNPVTWDQGNIMEIFRILKDEYSRDDKHINKIIGNLFESIILNVYRAFVDGNNNYSVYYKNNKKISEIVKYIEDNIYNKIELGDIAKYFGYSKSYLSRIFKKETGFTIHTYINHQKIEKSRQYLTQTNMSITEISDKLGYSSVHHFSNLFKENINISPLNYREYNKKVQ